MTDIEQIKQEVSNITHEFDRKVAMQVIDYLHSRGYLGGVQKWQPIESATIEGCLWVMLGHPDYHVSEIGYYNKRYNVWVDGSDRTLFMPNGPTHWMPLPAAPKGETK